MKPEPRIELVDESGAARFFTMHDAVDLEGVSYLLVEASDGGDEVLVLRERSDGLEAVDGEERDRVLSAMAEAVDDDEAEDVS